MSQSGKPIETIIEKAFSKREVQSLTASWRVEPVEIIKILVSHFREMGIFFVTKDQEEIINKNVMLHLKNSPEIMAKIAQARRAEDQRRTHRNSDE